MTERRSRQAILDREESFRAWVEEIQDRLRHALVAGHGVEAGREAAAEALGYAWQHWERIRDMENPAGYVYRVGQRMARRRRRRAPVLPEVPHVQLPLVEPGLPRALEQLTDRQRAVVVLVHGYDMTYQETADLLGLSRSSVQRHLERGLAKLRSELGVEHA